MKGTAVRTFGALWGRDIKYAILLALAAAGLIYSRRAAATPGATRQPDELPAPAEVDPFAGLEEIVVTATRIVSDWSHTVVRDQAPLGIRQNNPMNIRTSGNAWVGELPDNGSGYESFATASDGIRAGAKLLRNYYRLHGLDTVAGIISRWAPAADKNPTAGYIAYVAGDVGHRPDEHLDMNSPAVIADLAAAIIHFENGKNPYTMAYIRTAVERAFT